MTLRFGILGAGRIGQIHARNLALFREEANLSVMFDPFIDRDRFKNASFVVVTDEDEFFDSDIDAVIIASPTCEHRRHLERSIHKGLHIFCEKPLDLTLAAHHDIKALLEKTGVKMQIGFNRRFDRDFEKIKAASINGEFGTPYLLRITSRDPGLPSIEYLKTSGGMLFDMSIHDFDMARFIMQSEVIEVFAQGAALVDKSVAEIGDIDTAVISLQFKNGAFGIIDNSRQAVYGYDQRVELFTSRGSLANANHRPTTVMMSNQHGAYHEPQLNFFLERYQDSYVKELHAFITNCQNNRALSPNIDDAIAAINLVVAATESMKLNAPVTVN